MCQTTRWNMEGWIVKKFGWDGNEIILSGGGPSRVVVIVGNSDSIWFLERTGEPISQTITTTTTTTTMTLGRILLYHQEQEQFYTRVPTKKEQKPSMQRARGPMHTHADQSSTNDVLLDGRLRDYFVVEYTFVVFCFFCGCHPI
mmetsp:Transcript_7658/g.21300  ORF Transcript_7658/g.21300 Transcript_7658/m.21300 type:complete len:144 (-) Transcript_7658:59-490(-)